MRSIFFRVDDWNYCIDCTECDSVCHSFCFLIFAHLIWILSLDFYISNVSASIFSTFWLFSKEKYVRFSLPNFQNWILFFSVIFPCFRFFPYFLALSAPSAHFILPSHLRLQNSFSNLLIHFLSISWNFHCFEFAHLYSLLPFRTISHSFFMFFPKKKNTVVIDLNHSAIVPITFWHNKSPSRNVVAYQAILNIIKLVWSWNRFTLRAYYLAPQFAIF